MNHKTVAILMLVFAFSQCKDQQFKPLGFFQVKVSTPKFINFNAVELEGQVLDLGNVDAGTCGFIWSYDQDAVENITSGVAKITLPITEVASDGVFSSNLQNLDLHKIVYFRAFVTATVNDVGERTVYSPKTEQFSVEQVVINTGIVQIVNDSAIVFGQLKGLTNQMQAVEQHGHVISALETVPALGCDSCTPFMAGSSNDDAVFSSHFPHLAFNTTYYYRGYAIAFGDTFYTQTVDTFRVRDGWEPVAKFPYGYSEGSAVTLGGAAFAGFGAKILGAQYDDLNTDFWKFDPQSDNGNGAWTAAPPLSAFVQKRYNATLFQSNGLIHAIFGEYQENNTPNPLNDFNVLDPAAGVWNTVNIGAVFPDGRSGAVSFTVNGKIYVGSGKDANFKELDDFKEYDPTTGMWRAVASLPLRRNITELPEAQGRFDAVAFSAGGYGYVGCGQWYGAALRDFWKFTPPTGPTDPGSWTFETFLPGEGRYEATAFEIDGKGYIGSGYNPTAGGYLKDWWQYNPATQAWKTVAYFPGLPRTRAMAFSIDNNGYTGTGNTKVLLNGGLSSTEFLLSDIWRYIPENQ